MYRENEQEEKKKSLQESIASVGYAEKRRRRDNEENEWLNVMCALFVVVQVT
jgi:hypothetical protein